MVITGHHKFSFVKVDNKFITCIGCKTSITINSNKIYFNKSESYVGILNEDPRSYLYVGANGNLFRLATVNAADSYYSQLATNDNLNNSNNSKIKLISPINQQLITSPNNYDVSGSIYYYTTGSNPTHTFNYESNGVITPLMIINRTGTTFINTNPIGLTNNEKLVVNGNVLFNNSNSSNPTSVVIGNNSGSNISIFQTFGTIISGTSNSEASSFGLYVNRDVKFNSNLIINSNLTVGSNLIVSSNLFVSCNLTVRGVISGIGSNISNIKISSLYLDDSSNKLNANFIRINSNTGLATNTSNELIINFDKTKFMMTSNNQLSISNSAIASYWLHL